MKKIFSILFALVLVVSLGLVTTAPVLAGTIRNVPDDYSTIQEAIDAAGPGDTIMVVAGEYTDFLVQGKSNISIISTEGATVSTAGHFWIEVGPIEIAWAMAAVYGSQNINIEGINFDGTGVSGEDVVGIAYADSTGRIADLTVENIIGTGLMAGVAIIGYVDTSVVDLSGVTVENSMAGVAILNAEANLAGCTIAGTGVGILVGWPDGGFDPSTVTVQGSTMSNNDGGIYVCAASTLEAHFNNIVGNTAFGVVNDGGGTVDATYNWWGHATGPSGFGPGHGDAVSGNVDFQPWLEAEAEVVTERVTDGTVDAREEADTEVVVKGTATVTVARYEDNPGGLPPTGSSSLNPLDKYIDVYVPDTTKTTETEIKLYYTDAEVAAAGVDEESLRLFWWDGTTWVQCSPDAASGVNTTDITIDNHDYSGYMWARITEDTRPSLTDDLGGTPWGGYGHPTEVDVCGCFIATAAYGTDTAKEIDILREFRDAVLLPSSLGARLVSFYYRTSSPIANFISQHEVLRTAVRVGFVDPIVAILNWSHDLWWAGGS